MHELLALQGQGISLVVLLKEDLKDGPLVIVALKVLVLSYIIDQNVDIFEWRVTRISLRRLPKMEKF